MINQNAEKQATTVMTTRNKATREPELFRDIVCRWLKVKNLEEDWKRYTAFRTWEKISDDRLRKHTIPSRMVGKSLEVLVDSPPFHFELKNYRRRELLEKLKKANDMVEISDINFTCYRPKSLF